MDAREGVEVFEVRGEEAHGAEDPELARAGAEGLEQAERGLLGELVARGVREEIARENEGEGSLPRGKAHGPKSPRAPSAASTRARSSAIADAGARRASVDSKSAVTAGAASSASPSSCGRRKIASASASPAPPAPRRRA